MERLFIVKEGKIMNGDIHIPQVQLQTEKKFDTIYYQLCY